MATKNRLKYIDFIKIDFLKIDFIKIEFSTIYIKHIKLYNIIHR